MTDGIPTNRHPEARRVLIIDDDRDFADSLAHLLALEGYNVQRTYSAAAARQALKSFAAEVALIDIRLGGESGLDLVSDIRRSHPHILCVMMTAYASAETAIQALQEGIYDYVCKPFYSEDMTATLERCFERIHLSRERETAETQLRQAQKMKALGELTGGIAHDFNNLLAVIIGNLELVAEDVGDDADLRELIDDALSSAQSGKELTHRLLAFGRRQTLHPQQVNVGELVAGMLKLFERTLGEGVALEHIPNDDLWSIEVDKNQLEMSLLNLAINAHHAMPDGGTLRVETSNEVLSRSADAPPEGPQSGEYVMIAIADTGIGMSDAVAAEAVQPFFTTKQAGEGTGLGLSMVYGFVNQSGGHFAIASAVGKGTTVRLYLPRAAGVNRLAPDAPGHAGERDGAGERILLVEDRHDVRRTARRILTGLGYDVIEAADGHEALGLLSGEDRIDLLFTDIVLPGELNGLHLADEARIRRPDLKVLYTSGFAQDVLGDGNVDMDRIDLVRKPFTRDELAQRIRQSLKA
ncbi:MAG: response regulator [Hyphomicrobiaceae bacterium]|nr:response regulator [Hyphomicrobiaceae bacterium]